MNIEARNIYFPIPPTEPQAIIAPLPDFYGKEFYDGTPPPPTVWDMCEVEAIICQEFDTSFSVGLTTTATNEDKQAVCEAVFGWPDCVMDSYLTGTGQDGTQYHSFPISRRTGEIGYGILSGRTAEEAANLINELTGPNSNSSPTTETVQPTPTNIVTELANDVEGESTNPPKKFGLFAILGLGIVGGAAALIAALKHSVSETRKAHIKDAKDNPIPLSDFYSYTPEQPKTPSARVKPGIQGTVYRPPRRPIPTGTGNQQSARPRSTYGEDDEKDTRDANSPTRIADEAARAQILEANAEEGRAMKGKKVQTPPLYQPPVGE